MSARYVVYGAGAVGGVIAARLAQAEEDVALIARGAHLDAIRSGGLRLVTPTEDVTQTIPAAPDPADLRVGRDGDVVLLCVKGQDTLGALQALRAAGADRVPIVCVQNGVENERVALRRFPDVYGAVVVAPTSHSEPGVVEGTGTVLSGVVDVGRYPSGADRLADTVAEALSGARFDSRATRNVMELKYAKLLQNLGNAVGALFAESPAREELRVAVHEEGIAALQAAGIAHDPGDLDARREGLRVGEVPGRPRGGSSTWQSLARGSAERPSSVETDYLNGEVSLLGRLNGVATPLNDALCRLADELARDGGAPGSLDAGDVLVGART